jgi:hypothetical protein
MKRIINDNLSELEKKQMQTISKLQDKIKLMEFDISQYKKQKQILKRSLIDRKKSIKIAIKELENIRKEECYNKLSNVLVTLNSSLRERE